MLRNYGSQTKQLFSEFGLLRVEQIRIAQIGEFMYRYDHDLLPLVYKGFFCHTSSIHSYKTRGSNSYRRDYAHTNTRLFSIKFTGTLVWNNIPLAIRSSPNLLIFKKKLRSLLVNELIDLT